MSTKLSEIERKHTLVLIMPRAFYTELQLSLIDLVDLPDDTICQLFVQSLRARLLTSCRTIGFVTADISDWTKLNSSCHTSKVNSRRKRKQFLANLSMRDAQQEQSKQRGRCYATKGVSNATEGMIMKSIHMLCGWRDLKGGGHALPAWRVINCYMLHNSSFLLTPQARRSIAWAAYPQDLPEILPLHPHIPC